VGVFPAHMQNILRTQHDKGNVSTHVQEQMGGENVCSCLVSYIGIHVRRYASIPQEIIKHDLVLMRWAYKVVLVYTHRASFSCFLTM
jgi:hypothetical protein